MRSLRSPGPNNGLGKSVRVISEKSYKPSRLHVATIVIVFGFIGFLLLEPLTFLQCSHLEASYDNFSIQNVCAHDWFTEDNTTILSPMTEEMKEIVDIQRKRILKEMESYRFSSKITQKSLSELVPEQGGRPVVSIVVTTWRSGSTFFGGVLDSHSGTYHLSEPLTQFKTVQIRGEPLATPALTVLKNLLHCNYKTLDKYLLMGKTFQVRLFKHNTRLWTSCKGDKNLCFLPEFLTPMCKLFPFITMKTVHIRLRLLERLITDPELNLKIVYLVRDPRGTLRSRLVQPWCKKNPDCGDTTRLCADLIDDYAAALRFKQLFPTKFRIVRYEDMSLSPKNVIPEIFDFLGLYYSSDVQKFVTEHTTRNNSNSYQTYRDSSIVPLLWRQKLPFSKVNEIQQKCSIALAAWGYLPVTNESSLPLFSPLIQPFDLPLT